MRWGQLKLTSFIKFYLRLVEYYRPDKWRLNTYYFNFIVLALSCLNNILDLDSELCQNIVIYNGVYIITNKIVDI